jgi:hypothetical protein
MVSPEERSSRGEEMGKRRWWTICGAVAFVAWMPTATALAQPVVDFEEEADFTRPESWAMKYFGSVNLLTGFGSPEAVESGSMDLGVEIDWVPTLSDAERTVGFVGTKMEDLNKTSVFIRPWFTLGLPSKLSLTLTYLPPIEAFGVKPHLFGAAMGRPLYEATSWRVGLRGYGQLGTIEGDFTCDEATVAAGSDPDRNPFHCEQVSEDEYRLRSIGLELSTAWRFDPSSKLEPYAGLAINYLDTDFRVNALYAGTIDRTALLTDGFTVSFTAGLGYAFTDRLTLSGEVFYSPLDVVRPPSTSAQNDGLFNVRSLITYRIR